MVVGSTREVATKCVANRGGLEVADDFIQISPVKCPFLLQ